VNNRMSVFGGTGFIGSRFCEMFEDKVIKIDRDDYTPQTNNILYLISTINNYNVHTDLHVDVDTNLTVLMSVLEQVKKRKHTGEDVTFNFVSSWFVYGQNHEIPFREDTSRCTPAGFYSITKHCAEQLLISFCQTFDIKYRIFRLANVIGESDNKISKKKNALQFLIKEIVHGKDVPLYYGGEVLRDYIYVDDVCNAIELCTEKAKPNDIINIGSGKPYRFIELIETAIKYSNSKGKIINIQPTKFHDIVQVRHSYLETRKLKSYGFEQKFNIDEVIKKLVSFYQKEQWEL